jgi:hypothetical protein
MKCRLALYFCWGQVDKICFFEIDCIGGSKLGHIEKSLSCVAVEKK